MRKWLIATSMGLTLTLAACGDNTADISDEPIEEAPVVIEEEVTEEPAEETDVLAAELTEDSLKVEENEEFKNTIVYKNKDLGITGATGPIEYKIPAIQLQVLEIKSESEAALFGAEVGDIVHTITIEMTGENTSEEDIRFFLGQVTATTNTKEQLTPDMFLSEHIEGRYLGQVRHEGHNVYVLENSEAEDIESIELRISAPSNSNFESAGEDITEVIEINQ